MLNARALPTVDGLSGSVCAGLGYPEAGQTLAAYGGVVVGMDKRRPEPAGSSGTDGDVTPPQSLALGGDQVGQEAGAHRCAAQCAAHQHWLR